MGSFKRKTPFQLDGCCYFIGNTDETGGSLSDRPKAQKKTQKIRSMLLKTPSGEHLIKLPKDLRKTLNWKAVEGHQVRVTGDKTLNLKKGWVTLEAERIQILPDAYRPSESRESPAFRPHRIPHVDGADAPSRNGSSEDQHPQNDSSPAGLAPAQSAEAQAPKGGKILVCQKSDCCKRGARQLAKALASSLGDRQLDDRIQIKPTGCMKRCKKGPNLIMPDKTRYTRIRADEVEALLDRHFPTPTTEKEHDSHQDTPAPAPTPAREHDLTPSPALIRAEENSPLQRSA